MKAKLYIGITAALLLTGFSAKAQRDDVGEYRNNDARVVVNNYYDNYDYFYSSRINRFHRSYLAFDYYSPVYTDSYWYSYQPFSWGISIYGGLGFGLGFYSYPVYNYGYAYNYGLYDPYYGSYWGYDPYYYNNWYFPISINLNFGFNWPHWGCGYYGRYHNDYYYSHHYDDWGHRHDYDNYHDNYSRRYASSGNSYDRDFDRRSGTSNISTSRRVAPADRSDNSLQRSDSRRYINPSQGRVEGNRYSNGNNGGNNYGARRAPDTRISERSNSNLRNNRSDGNTSSTDNAGRRSYTGNSTIRSNGNSSTVQPRSPMVRQETGNRNVNYNNQSKRSTTGQYTRSDVNRNSNVSSSRQNMRTQSYSNAPVRKSTGSYNQGRRSSYASAGSSSRSYSSPRSSTVRPSSGRSGVASSPGRSGTSASSGRSSYSRGDSGHSSSRSSSSSERSGRHR